jgi:nucleolar protein 56
MRREELRNKAIQKTKEGIRKELIRRDRLIVHVVKTMDQIDKGTNLLLEQLREWYAIYFPELARSVEEPEEYLKLLINLKTKDQFTEKNVVELVGQKRYRLDLEHASKNSIGIELGQGDLESVISYAERIQTMRNERQKLETYLEKLMEEESPNIRAVAGAAIGARLIATAGSLEKLAEFPSSTIQVLGAEKALFSHLRKHTLPPKHGLIFAYPKLRGAPLKLRGKIARRLASKLSIAARVDFFKGEFVGDRLARELDEQISKIVKSK